MRRVPRRVLLVISGAVALLAAACTPQVTAPTTNLPTTTISLARAEISLPVSFDAVACHSPALCIAVGPTSQKADSSSSVFSSTASGRSWIARSLLDAHVIAAACGAENECSLAATLVHSGRSAVFWTADGGLTWLRTLLPLALAQPFGISCPDAATCVVTESTQTDKTVALATDDSGSTWSSVRLAPRTESLVCPSVSVCYAASALKVHTGDGTVAQLLRYELRGKALHLDLRTTVRYLDNVSGLGCASTMVCIGIASHPTPDGPNAWRLHFVSVFTTDGGHRWHFGGGPGAFGGWSIACPSTVVCIAVGAGDSSFPGRLALSTADGGHEWERATFVRTASYTSLFAASCASANFCVAAGGQQARPPGEPGRQLLVSSDSGRRWHPAEVVSTAS